MINILIADDHPIVRRGLREIIEDEPDMKIECEAASASEVIDNLRKHNIDVVLLDISMPGKSGLDLIWDLKKEFPDKPILVLSAMSEEIYAKRAIKSGALGFMNKESAPELLVEAIRKVESGKYFISEKMVELIANNMTGNKNDKLHEILSEREFEVLRLIGNGKSVGDIAKILNLSVTTISTYRARILEKLKMKNNSELIQYCINEKLILD
ncbi:MAG: response regulator transcription factor [Ignavibacteriaceae bacterium]